MTRSSAMSDPAVTERVNASQNTVSIEDVEAFERQHRSTAKNSNLPMRILNIDSGGSHARRVVERFIKEDADG